ncbi:MAG: Ig-like domain-containing protein [Terracidiphilus sp.]
MLDRLSPRALLLTGLVALALPFAGCTNPLVDSLAVSPATQSLGVGQTVQFTATGTIGHGSNHPSTTQDDTDSATWTSSTPAVASVSATGVATALTAGTTNITATMNGYTGTITASATLTVTTTSGGGGGSTPSGSVTTLTIIPSSQAVAVPSQTTQFIAIGTTSTGATENLTSQVSWSSSSSQIATIGASTGLATAQTQGTVTIIALYTSGGNTIAGTGTFTVSNGSTEKYTALTLIPSAQSVSASGQTGQLIALATSGTTGLDVDVTNSIQTTWTSSIPSIATITSGLASGNGVVTGVSQGSTTITAEVQNPDGTVVSATAAVTASLTVPAEPILSLTIVPSTISVNDFQLTGQYLAIATYSTAPYVRDVTNSPSTTWISTEPEIFPVDTNSGGNPGASAGLVTAYGSGGAVIVAESTSTDGTIQSATATFSCPEVIPVVGSQTPGSCYPGEPPVATLLETLTIYNEGLNTSNWLVTTSSATGTADVIHCGPGWTVEGNSGGSVCTATYPAGTLVILEASQPSGATGTFGGWSYNCTPSNSAGNPLPGPIYWTAAGPNYCVVDLSSNDTVGAIFN